MKVICFASTTEQRRKLNKEVLCRLPADIYIEKYKTLEDFSKRLLQPKSLDSIIIVCAGNIPELKKVCLRETLFLACRIILVLPDDNRETLNLAFKLYPRFYISIDQDFSKLVAVLQKMRDQLVGIPAQEIKPHSGEINTA